VAEVRSALTVFKSYPGRARRAVIYRTLDGYDLFSPSKIKNDFSWVGYFIYVASGIYLLAQPGVTCGRLPLIIHFFIFS
jgi:hypothetical protein